MRFMELGAAPKLQKEKLIGISGRVEERMESTFGGYRGLSTQAQMNFQSSNAANSWQSYLEPLSVTVFLGKTHQNKQVTSTTVLPPNHSFKRTRLRHSA